MNIETKAFRIIYDIICIVLRWDKKQISDNQAMREIVETLASEPEVENEFEISKEKKKSSQIKNKILIPSAICGVLVAFFVGASFPFAFDVDSSNISPEENTIRFEQQNQNPLELENEQSTVDEQFENQTIPESKLESGG